MTLPEDILVRVALFALGLAGFLVARHIYKHKKSAEEPLVCMVGFDCHAVVHSDYSKFFGIPVEILGMFYYGLVTLFYFAIMFVPGILHTALVGFMILLSSGAFLFSVYLIAVQIFILKKGCSWCIVSAGVSTIIFTITVLFYDFGSVLTFSLEQLK
jgi:uncharacterized membrane protein